MKQRRKNMLWCYVCCFLMMSLFTACSSDGYPDVDGKHPTVTLTTEHIRTEAGREFTISGLIEDLDGIHTIKLQGAELQINKTIDLLEIYQEPIYSYKLEYKFTVPNNSNGETFPLLITVTDLNGRTTESKLTISLDGDFEDPFFTVVPSGTVTVLMKDRTKLNLRFTAEDKRGVDYVAINIPELNYTDTIAASGVSVFEYSGVIELPSEVKTYNMTLTIVDQFAHKVSKSCNIDVTALPDFQKMYLVDIADVKLLTSDLFGIPMLIDRVGEYQYEARYYSKARGTEVRFVPQKTDFYPICFGISPDDTNKLTDEPEISKPIVLQEKGYYKITFNTKSGDYNVESYTPIDDILPYGQLVDPNPDDIVEANKYPFSMVISGAGIPTIDNNDTWSPNWNNSLQLTQDAENKYLLYLDMHLTKGRRVEFAVYPYHPWGWWLTPAFHFENKSGGSEYCVRNDNRMNMTSVYPPADGEYRFEIDYHLLRGKLYPID